MSFAAVPVTDWLTAPTQFDALIDVRSPAEFAEDHLPGAVNWPVLDDAERARVGTLYVQVSTFEARKVGAALVSRRIADTLERFVADKPKDWRPLVYCWRGGQRSGSLSLVLAQIGFKTRQLQGGYKAFRAAVREQLAAQCAQLDLRVISGRTGSGKTRLLAALAEVGAQVIDLEGLAAHRGSILGGLPDRPQPSQKLFETELWQVVRGLDPSRPVFIESESRRIGQRQVPDALLSRMQASAQRVQVDMPLDSRIALLMDDYASFVQQPEALCERLDGLVELRGRATVLRWQGLARQRAWPELLAELLAQHYDPLYDRAWQQGQSRGGAQAQALTLQDTKAETLQQAALALHRSA